ncbi:MAG: protein-disulfide reductase DsbD domain-containing protein [Pseudomonadota bacterium]
MTLKNMFSALLTIASISAVSPLNAAETAWFETDGGNVRILTEPFMPGATSVRGLIDIDLLPGWKTYWRDPGSGGIPPSIQINDAGLVTETEIKFPTPIWISSKYGSYAGYDAPVQIPFTLHTNGPLVEQDIATRVFIGICKDICIPAFSDFDLSVTQATGSSKTGIAVAAAFDALPKQPEEFGISITTSTVMAQKLAIEISGAGEGFSFFVSGQKGEQFNRPILVSANSETTVFHVEPTDPFEDGQQVEVMLTGQTDEATFETSVPVVFASP